MPEFHVALRTAVEARGLTLERLRHRLEERGLRVGVSSLSYWQSGLRRPERPESIKAVAALEEILALPPTSLTSLLRPRRRGPAPYAAIMRQAAALGRLLEELGAVVDDRRLHIAGMYESVRVGPDRGILRRETSQVVQAHEERADRYIMIYRADPQCDVERVEITALEDCRIGRIRRDAATCLVVAELLFDRALRTGETHVLRYELTDPSGGEAREYERGFRFPAGHYTLRVGFHPAALPVRLRRYARRAAGDESVEELTLNSHHSAHLTASSLQPGVVGIGWDWP
ncbi:hypothetical protein [Microtetraspora fusca]|uniref:hypothetical protein n=1 Tax=Microtetraspora fusca TaxID=1997 RepID=UPI0008305A23|nr:hypothetical protein [Microtetraspora fusca]